MKNEDGHSTQLYRQRVRRPDENIQWLTDTLGEGTDRRYRTRTVKISSSTCIVSLLPGAADGRRCSSSFFSKMNAGGNNKAFDFAKSRAKIQSNVKVRFKDVAGCDEEKEEVREIIDYLKNPKQFTRYGSPYPEGLVDGRSAGNR